MTERYKHEQPIPGPAQLWMPPDGEFPVGPLTTDGALTLERIEGDTALFLPTEEGMAGMTVPVCVLENEASGWRHIGTAGETAKSGRGDD